MIKAPYDRNRNYDIIFEKLILGVKKTIGEKDDDFVLITGGSTGTGKSNLNLWAYTIYDPDGCSPDFIGLDRQTHAMALKKASEKKQPRFCLDDEANVNKRDAMSKYNKQRIDLYLAIRGLQIFHAWCNPSVEMLDKAFIEERIKGLAFVLTKDIDRPRIYYYFTKNGLLKMLKEQGDIKQETIKKFGKKYAYYQGWFRKYEGPLLAPYLEKKEERMSTKVNEFFETYGEVWFNVTNLAKKLGCHRTTIKKRHDALVQEGILVQDKHYRVNEVTNKVEWNESSMDFFRLYGTTVTPNSSITSNINKQAFDNQNIEAIE